jgi:hypothetical protein
MSGSSISMHFVAIQGLTFWLLDSERGVHAPYTLNEITIVISLKARNCPFLKGQLPPNCLAIVHFTFSKGGYPLRKSLFLIKMSDLWSRVLTKIDYFAKGVRFAKSQIFIKIEHFAKGAPFEKKFIFDQNE